MKLSFIKTDIYIFLIYIKNYSYWILWNFKIGRTKLHEDSPKPNFKIGAVFGYYIEVKDERA